MQNKTLLRLSAIGMMALAITFQSCKKDDETTVDNTKNYQNGVFVINEGAFGTGSGSISFWSNDNSVHDNDIYTTVNGVPLGNVVQSMAMHFGKAYLVVNNANKVEVVDKRSIKSAGTITGLELPRYFTGFNESKGYITEWVSFGGAGRVSVVDLATNTVTKTIAVGILPEKMTLLAGRLYVANSNDNTISVINTTTDVVENTITVGDWPSSIESDINGNLWVLCGGVPTYAGTATSPTLVKFNPNSPNAQTVFDFGTPDNNPTRMTINGQRNKLFYLYNGGVYSFDISASGLSTSPIISRYFYGLGVDPTDGTIYGADAGGFTSAGKVIKYNTSYTAVDSFTTDIGTSDFSFIQ